MVHKTDDEPRAKQFGEPIYELGHHKVGKYLTLVGEVYTNWGNQQIQVGTYPVTTFTYLGFQRIIPADERGYFESEDLEKIIREVDAEFPRYDLDGKPFFVNAFLLTRWTGRMENGHIRRPIEFFQVEVDKKKKLRI